jgi:hypothetical protein
VLQDSLDSAQLARTKLEVQAAERYSSRLDVELEQTRVQIKSLGASRRLHGLSRRSEVQAKLLHEGRAESSTQEHNSQGGGRAAASPAPTVTDPATPQPVPLPTSSDGEESKDATVELSELGTTLVVPRELAELKGSRPLPVEIWGASPPRGPPPPPSETSLRLDPLTPAGATTSCTLPFGQGNQRPAHYIDESTASLIRSQYELRVSSESSVGIPATLLAGFAVDLLSGLQSHDNASASLAVQAEAVCLGIVVIINLAVVLIFSTLYWAGIRVFCATTRSDAQMIDAFELFWHDDTIKRIRATARTLFFVSPFVFMVGVLIHVYENLGAATAGVLAMLALLVFYPVWNFTILVCKMVGHKFALQL